MESLLESKKKYYAALTLLLVSVAILFYFIRKELEKAKEHTPVSSGRSSRLDNGQHPQVYNQSVRTHDQGLLQTNLQQSRYQPVPSAACTQRTRDLDQIENIREIRLLPTSVSSPSHQSQTTGPRWDSDERQGTAGVLRIAVPDRLVTEKLPPTYEECIRLAKIENL